MKENLHYKQLQLNYINNHPKEKKEHTKFVIASIGVDAAAKFDDDVQQNLLMFFICFLLGQVVENNESDAAALKIFR